MRNVADESAWTSGETIRCSSCPSAGMQASIESAINEFFTVAIAAALAHSTQNVWICLSEASLSKRNVVKRAVRF
jgi:hypothetical protein